VADRSTRVTEVNMTTVDELHGTRPGKPDTNTSFNTQISTQTDESNTD